MTPGAVFQLQKIGPLNFECRSDETCTPVVYSKKFSKTFKLIQANPKSISDRQNGRHKNYSWVIVTSNAETITGKVNGIQEEFIVDRGAEITVVPSNLVSRTHLWPNTIEIVRATWVALTTRLAEAEFGIFKKCFLKTVGVASSVMLRDRVLYSDLCNHHVQNSF